MILCFHDTRYLLHPLQHLILGSKGCLSGFAIVAVFGEVEDFNFHFIFLNCVVCLEDWVQRLGEWVNEYIPL